jgi:LysM repeat protein
MRNRLERRIRLRTWLSLAILSVAVAGCFQTAGDAILNPSPVGLPTIATLQMETPTPFVTPISTIGFVPPTDDPNTFLTLTAIASFPVDVTTPTDNFAGTTPTLQVFPPTVEGSTPGTVDTGVNTVVETSAPIFAPTTPALLSTPTALSIQEGPCVHTVQPGEWLFAIARKYNINPEDLKTANPQFAGRYDQLQPGDVLNIPNCNQPTATPIPPTGIPTTEALPAPGQPTPIPIAGTPSPMPTPIPLTGRIYTVAPGDTLGAIARKFGITVQALKEANGLTNDALAVGQQLQIPRAP